MKISVILPTIGRSSLKNSIDSITAQTYKDIEIIIVDDSEKQSVSAQGHILLRTGGLKGPSHSRNIGASIAKGELLAFLDDDDLWRPNKISEQLKEIQENNWDILLSSALVNEKVRPYPDYVLKAGQDPLELLYAAPHIFKSRAYFPTASYLIKSSVFKTINFREDITDRENLLFLGECFREGFRLSQSDKVLIEVNYQKNNSLSRMSLESEHNWFLYLFTLNESYARNFLIESARNFLRRKDFKSAKLVLNWDRRSTKLGLMTLFHLK